jgi:hypothetical protein
MFGRMSVHAEILFAVYVLFILNIPRYVVEKKCFFDLVVKHKGMNHWMQKRATLITAILSISRNREEDLDVCVDGILIQLLYFLDICQPVFFPPLIV